MGTKYEEDYLTYLKAQKNYSEKTIDSYRRDLASFNAFLQRRKKKQADVDLKLIRDYLSLELRRGVSKRSCQRRLSCFRGYYDYLQKHEEIESNPFRRIRSPKQDIKYPDRLFPAEVGQLLEENAKREDPLVLRDQAILTLILSSGLRASEVVALQLSQIDFSSHYIRVRGKGDKDRVTTINKEAEAAVKKYVLELRPALIGDVPYAQRPKEVFLNNKGKKLTVRGLEYILTSIETKTGLSLHLHPHELRHTYATELFDRGADLRLIQELLGHESINTTQIYTHLSQKDLQDEYAAYFPKRKKK